MVECANGLDKVFGALADPTRIRMVEQLSRGELSVSDLAEPLDMTLAGASKHINVLEKAGLLTREKRGRSRICKLTPTALDAASDWVQRYSEFWNQRLDALDIALKEDTDE